MLHVYQVKVKKIAMIRVLTPYHCEFFVRIYIDAYPDRLYFLQQQCPHMRTMLIHKKLLVKM